MKYIKLFEGFESDLQEFCDTHLAYLLDEGFKVRIIMYNKHSDIIILKGNLKYGGNSFKWYDVKDYIIPFIEILNNKYNTRKSVEFNYQTKRSLFAIESIINDSIANKNLLNIGLSIRND